MKQVGLRSKRERECSSDVESVMLTTCHAVYAIMMSCAHATPIPVVAALRPRSVRTPLCADPALCAYARALFVVCRHEMQARTLGARAGGSDLDGCLGH